MMFFLKSRWFPVLAAMLCLAACEGCKSRKDAAPAAAPATAAAVTAPDPVVPATPPASTQPAAAGELQIYEGRIEQLRREWAFAVQLKAVQDSVQADSLAVQLRALGYPAFHVAADLKDKGVWRRIRLGPAGSRLGAETWLRQAASDPRVHALLDTRAADFFVAPSPGHAVVAAAEAAYLREPELHGVVVSSVEFPDGAGHGLVAWAPGRTTARVVWSVDKTVHDVPIPLMWEDCVMCKSIPFDGPGAVTEVRPALAGRLFGERFPHVIVLEITLDQSHKLWQVIVPGGDGVIESQRTAVVREWTSSRDTQTASPWFADAADNGFRYLILEKTWRRLHGRSLCKMWRDVEVLGPVGMRVAPVEPSGFIKRGALALGADEMRSLSLWALRNRYFTFAADAMLDRIKREPWNETYRDDAAALAEGLEKAGANFVLARFHAALITPGFPLESMGRVGFEKAMKRVIEDAQIIRDPGCDAAPLAAVYDPKKPSLDEEGYLKQTAAFVDPVRVPYDFYDILGRNLYPPGNELPPFMKTWLGILRKESPDVWENVADLLNIAKPEPGEQTPGESGE
ncbi:MAG: hypothetical protein GMKNLPBB_02535 [Myxococcota bacterium]|nr:hypothetical protein [Myxococcota bacterium]